MEQLLAGKDTCVTPVLDFAEAVVAEQTKANEMVLNVEDAELGSYRQLGFAMKLSKTPAALRSVRRVWARIRSWCCRRLLPMKNCWRKHCRANKK